MLFFNFTIFYIHLYYKASSTKTKSTVENLRKCHAMWPKVCGHLLTITATHTLGSWIKGNLHENSGEKVYSIKTVFKLFLTFYLKGSLTLLHAAYFKINFDVLYVWAYYQSMAVLTVWQRKHNFGLNMYQSSVSYQSV